MFLLFCSEVWQVLLPESFSYRLRNCLYGYLWRDSFQESLPAVRECLILLQDNISQILGKWAGGLVPLRRQVFLQRRESLLQAGRGDEWSQDTVRLILPGEIYVKKKDGFEQAFHVGSSDMTALSRRSCGFMADDDLLVFVYNKRGCIFYHLSYFRSFVLLTFQCVTAKLIII